jgi:hypothetical protein
MFSNAQTVSEFGTFRSFFMIVAYLELPNAKNAKTTNAPSSLPIWPPQFCVYFFFQNLSKQLFCFLFGKTLFAFVSKIFLFSLAK